MWVVFWLLGLGAAPAQTALPPWSDTANKAWWAANPTPNTWAKAADALQSQLEAIYQKGGSATFSQPDFAGWMEHLEWVRLGLADPSATSKPADLATFFTLGQAESISHLFVRKLAPRDDKPAALQNLMTLEQAGLGDLQDYAALGVAFCLVFDEPFPANWPHAQVPQSTLPLGDLDIVKRFQFYVQANKAKKLDLDLTQLREEDLKYLVDSKVRLSELTYAQQSKIPYENFEQAFFSIVYDEKRVDSSNLVLDWSFPTYTLQDIEQHGGICVDQAYYASELGKGRGIPTIYFHGQGEAGGHAWFGYLTRTGKWNLDCGRYASQNYPKGYALDPQTWQEVNDATLKRLAKDGDSDPRYEPAQTALAWARLHEGAPIYPQILEDARTLMPELAAPWQAEGDFIDKSPTATLPEKKSFYQSWMNQFTNDADMKVEAQKRLLAALKAANDPDADSLQRDIVLENRSTGFDLGVQGSLGTIDDKFKAQDWDGAKVAFETSVRDFKDQGGGTFFHDVISPYMMICLQYGRPEQAEDGLHFTEERMPMRQGSLIQIEFDRLKQEVNWGKLAFAEADKWLAEIDGGQYAQAWQDASSEMRSHESQQSFIANSTTVRTLWGRCISRTMSAPPQMSDGITVNGQPRKGNFVIARYASVFEHSPSVKETVWMMRDDDGIWRTMVYFYK